MTKTIFGCTKLKKDKTLSKIIVVLVVISSTFTLLFGITGLKTFSAFLLFFFLPIFVIINNLDLELDEKVFFSFFVSLALFSLVVWYINRVIYSLRISVMVAFFLLIFIGLAMSFYHHKNP